MLTATDIKALETLAEDMAESHNPWWIFGSAAVALHGSAEGPLKTIDVAVSPGDFRRLVATHGPSNKGFSSPLLRARQLLSLEIDGVHARIMHVPEVHAQGRWHAIRPATRLAFRVNDATLYTPERAELIALLELAGTKRDLAAAARLRDAATPFPRAT